MVLDDQKQRFIKPLLHVQRSIGIDSLQKLPDTLYQVQIIQPNTFSEELNSFTSSLNFKYYKLSSKLECFVTKEFQALLKSNPNLHFRGIAEDTAKCIRTEITSSSLFLTVPKDIYEQLGLIGKKLKRDTFFHAIEVPLIAKKSAILDRAKTFFQRIFTDNFNFIFSGNAEFFSSLTSLFPHLEPCPIKISTFSSSHHIPLFSKWLTPPPPSSSSLKRKREGKARSHIDPISRHTYLHILEWVGLVLHHIDAQGSDPYISMHAVDTDIQAPVASLVTCVDLQGWVSVPDLVAGMQLDVPTWRIWVAKSKPSHAHSHVCDLVVVQYLDQRLIYRVPIADPFLVL